jgi:hypothetical protein
MANTAKGNTISQQAVLSGLGWFIILNPRDRLFLIQTIQNWFQK